MEEEMNSWLTSNEVHTVQNNKELKNVRDENSIKVKKRRLYAEGNINIGSSVKVTENYCFSDFKMSPGWLNSHQNINASESHRWILNIFYEWLIYLIDETKLNSSTKHSLVDINKINLISNFNEQLKNERIKLDNTTKFQFDSKHLNLNERDLIISTEVDNIAKLINLATELEIDLNSIEKITRDQRLKGSGFNFEKYFYFFNYKNATDSLGAFLSSVYFSKQDMFNPLTKDKVGRGCSAGPDLSSFKACAIDNSVLVSGRDNVEVNCGNETSPEAIKPRKDSVPHNISINNTKASSDNHFPIEIESDTEAKAIVKNEAEYEIEFDGSAITFNEESDAFPMPKLGSNQKERRIHQKEYIDACRNFKTNNVITIHGRMYRVTIGIEDYLLTEQELSTYLSMKPPSDHSTKLMFTLNDPRIKSLPP